MRVLAHPDPVVLEQELVHQVGRLQAGDPLARVLILVPTLRLADHVRRRLAQARGACLGVEVTHHRALVLRLLEQSDGPALVPASGRILEAALAAALSGMDKENVWAEFARRRPGARRALLATLRELREAGLAPEDVRGHLETSSEERDLAEVYARYTQALERHRPRGLADDAALVDAALPLAAAFAGHLAGIIHHGAYELTGIYLRLLLALDRVTPVTYLLPAEPGAPAFAYSERFARRFLLEPDGELRRLDETGRRAGLLGLRLPILYKEDRRPAPFAPRRVGFLHAQGSAAEITAVIRQALAAVREGVEPEEIAFVARNLAPYDAAFEAILDGRELPWSGSSGTPLRRQPVAHDLIRLLQILRDDFPRAATAGWLASPRIRWEVLLPEEPAPPADLADRWSRQAGLLGGLAEWTEDLLAWARAPDHREGASQEERTEAERLARQRGEQARCLGRALTRLAEQVDPASDRSWTAHAELIDSLLTVLLPGSRTDLECAAVGHLSAVLGEMCQLETVLGDTRPIPFADMVAWLEDAIGATAVPARDPGSGGFRVLDAMQARGLTFRRVFLVGMHAGLFPRVPREDPFLSDGARERLRQGCHAPLPVKMEGEDEERLILALLLGSAAENLQISWQRADENGRSRMPSLALREIGRIVLGQPALEMAQQEAHECRSHPASFLEDLAFRPGLLAPDEDRLLAALRCRSAAEAARTLGDSAPELLPGLTQVAALESFTPAALEYDGRVGPDAHVRPVQSVSGIERLGRCPLQYFFAHVLGIRGEEEEPSDSALALRELGTRIHGLMETLYRRLAGEGAIAEDAAGSQRRARALFDELWPGLVADVGRRRAARLPVLWDLVFERWRRALARFLDEDLARLIAEGCTGIELEVDQQRTLELPGGITLPLRGRFDRRLVLRDGAVLIGDYKTGGSLRDHVDKKSFLKLHRLQVPLYWLLGGRDSGVELLGLGPDYDEGGRLAEHRQASFPELKPPEEEGLRESLAVLIRLLNRRSFPLREGDHCRWCDFRQACRRNHPPTGEREEQAADARDYRDVQRKNTRKPLLAQLREERG
jgi:RecB family exonuclease